MISLFESTRSCIQSGTNTRSKRQKSWKLVETHQTIMLVESVKLASLGFSKGVSDLALEPRNLPQSQKRSWRPHSWHWRQFWRWREANELLLVKIPKPITSAMLQSSLSILLWVRWPCYSHVFIVVFAASLTTLKGTKKTHGWVRYHLTFCSIC